MTAQATMSPVLKQAVPVGSLESRVIKSLPQSATEKKRIDLVSQGWKMDCFDSAAEKISGAGLRLQDEAQRESRYWEQISQLKADGWAISRLPRDSRTVGVHFGFAEATPTFRNRGFAVLRRGREGYLLLDPVAIPAKPVAVQVIISGDGHEQGRSMLPKLQDTDDTPIDKQILQARNTLFEEELFYEISRESRILASYGVEMSARSISFHLENGWEVQMRLSDLEVESSSKVSTLPANKTAELIAFSVRALLSHAHELNFHRRSKPPLPMTLKARHVPEYALLRPVLSHLQHNSHMDSLRSFLAAVIPPLSNAGITAGTQISQLAHVDFSSLSKNSTLSPGPLVEALMAPLESKITFTLPTARLLDLKIKTFMGPPTFGTEYHVGPLSYKFGTLTPPRLAGVTDVEDFVCHALAVDIAFFVEALHSKNKLDDQSPEDPTSVGWRVINPHDGELSMPQKSRGDEKIQVKVWHNRLGLRFVSRASKHARRSENTTYVWEAGRVWKATATEREQFDKQQLSQVVRELSEGVKPTP